MGIFSKIITIALTVGGVALVSQLPEFTQQYRQRLGGAVTELRTVVENFEKDANASSMSREQALDEMKSSTKQFPRDRGLSMEKTIDRYGNLSVQQIRMEHSNAIARPVHLLRYPDKVIMKEAWQIFEPAVPLNQPGAVYGGVGGLIGFLLARLGIGTSRRLRRNRNDRALGIEKQNSKKQHGLLVNGDTPPAASPANHRDASLLETPNVKQPSLLADVTFDQRIRGEVNAQGRVVDLDN